MFENRLVAVGQPTIDRLCARGKFDVTIEELAEMEKPINGHFVPDLREYCIDMSEPTRYVYWHADENIKPDLQRFTFDMRSPKITPYQDFSRTPGVKPKHKNPRLMVFVSTLLSDRAEGILRSFDHAYRQVPKGGPGIIYIDINTELYRPPQEVGGEFAIVRRRIEGKLNIVSRINAVILTASSYLEEKERAFCRVEVSSFKNSSPSSELSKEFLDNICKLRIR